MREFSVGDIVRRKEFLGMTLVHHNRDYIVSAIATERADTIFKLMKPDKGLFIYLDGIKDYCFDEHNFIMMKKAIPDDYMDEELFII